LTLFAVNRNAKIAALTMHISAKLKFGQFGSLIQSVTAPRNNPGKLNALSVKFPIAPPKSSAKQIAQARLVKNGA
jgi:hypothetical protein